MTPKKTCSTTTKSKLDNTQKNFRYVKLRLLGHKTSSNNKIRKFMESTLYKYLKFSPLDSVTIELPTER